MRCAPRPAVVSTRVPLETKAALASLASRQGLTESALLALSIDRLLGASLATGTHHEVTVTRNHGRANDRVTLRLRPGDRTLAEVRAAGRHMKMSRYLAMLIRAHVRAAPVMPPAELDALKSLAGRLSAIERHLKTLCVSRHEPATAPCAPNSLMEFAHTVQSVREAVASVVRANLMSWEIGHG